MGTALAAGIGAGGGVLEGLLGQKGMSGNVQKHLAREQLHQSAAQIAAKLQAQLATMPLADRAAFLMMGRLQNPGGNFAPRDFFNGTGGATPQYGGPDLNAVQKFGEGYKPGMGGYDPGALRADLKDVSTYQTSAGAGTPWAAGNAGPAPVAPAPGTPAPDDERTKAMATIVARMFGGQRPASGFAPGGLTTQQWGTTGRGMAPGGLATAY